MLIDSVVLVCWRHEANGVLPVDLREKNQWLPHFRRSSERAYVNGFLKTLAKPSGLPARPLVINELCLSGDL
jgi:hypothetical protein